MHPASTTRVDHISPDPSPAAVRCLLFLILIAAAIVRIHFYRGFNSSDEMTYLRSACDLAYGQYHLSDVATRGHGFLRHTLIFPMALCIKLFGRHDGSCAVPFFVVSLASIVVVYLLARDLCRSSSAGLLAAALLAFNNRDISCATRAYPDAMQSLFLACCMWLLIRSSRGVTEDANPRAYFNRPGPLEFLSGAVFALALNTNIISVMFVPVIAATLLLTRGWRRGLQTGVKMLAGFLVIYGPLMLIYWIRMGTPFLEIRAIGYTDASRGENGDVGAQFASNARVGWHTVWFALTTPERYQILNVLLFEPGFLSILRPAAWCGLLLLIHRDKDRHRRRAAWLVLAWLALLYAAYEFGAIWLPLRKTDRYCHMMIIPAVMVIVVTLRPVLRDASARRGILMGLVFCLALVFLFIPHFHLPARPDGSTEMGWDNAAGFLVHPILLSLLFAARSARPRIVILATLCAATAFGTATLTAEPIDCTRLGRALRHMKPPGKIQTNCWRIQMFLDSLHLYDPLGSRLHATSNPSDFQDAADRGNVVLVDRRPDGAYGLTAMSLRNTRLILKKFEQQSIDREIVMRQSRWDSLLPVEPGATIRRSFVAQQNVRAEWCALEVAGCQPDVADKVSITLLSDHGRTLARSVGAEWQPRSNTLLFCFPETQFQQGQSYWFEFTAHRELRSPVKLRAMAARGQPDLVFALFKDLGPRYVLHQPLSDSALALMAGDSTALEFPCPWPAEVTRCDFSVEPGSTIETSDVRLTIIDQQTKTSKVFQADRSDADVGRLSFALKSMSMRAGRGYKLVLSVASNTRSVVHLKYASSNDALPAATFFYNDVSRSGAMTVNLAAESARGPILDKCYDDGHYQVFKRRP